MFASCERCPSFWSRFDSLKMRYRSITEEFREQHSKLLCGECWREVTARESKVILEQLQEGKMEVKDVVCPKNCEPNDAVMWNPYNKVVQCHRCGQIYVPKVYSEKEVEA